MKIGLVGYGKMGKMTEAAARARGHEIVSISDPALERAGEKLPVPPRPEAADVLVEFTRPDTALDNINAAAALGRPIVVGTTGWYDRLPEAEAAVERAGTAVLWSPNFSLGVNIFYRIAAAAAAAFDPFDEYDAAGYEVHHNKKTDSPSGTAKALVLRVLAAMTRKTDVIWESPNEKIPPGLLHYASLRLGAVPGTHTMLFDSPADTVEIKHTARSREGFASGAVRAAEWLAVENRRGVFTMDDVLGGLIDLSGN